MARLNTHLSATPQQTRASTVDSLYRDPSVAPHGQSNARTPSYSVLSPSRSLNSDKENDTPASRQNTPRPSKARGPRGAPGPMRTPDSGPASGGHGNKRRRTGTHQTLELAVFEDELEPESEAQDDDHAGDDAQSQAEVDGEDYLRFFNPNQDRNLQRKIRFDMRENARLMDENRDEIVRSNGMLLDALRAQDNLFGKVRQTADAALDSRFLVNASELAGKKLNNSLHGNAGVGIELDLFVSKCIQFMNTGGHPDDAPVIPVPDREEEEDGDALDWALLGRRACFPCNRRPPVSSFLLGPLSVQKRVRVTQRKARSQRQPVGPATRPEEIKEGDIQQSEHSNLSTLVTSINARLRDHIETADGNVYKELEELGEDNVDDEDLAAAVMRQRAAICPSKELAVGLLDFAINPRDFGQTVENLFYISFLVREGAASIMKDQDGLPLLMPAKAHEIHEQREKNAQKHQAVFSIDYTTWRMFIEAFDIKESLIPHREQEEVDIGSGAWYTG